MLASQFQGYTQLPEGGVFVRGDGTIEINGQVMSVDQLSQLGVTDWQSFNIGAENGVIFAMPDGGAHLARVLGGNLSDIAGFLQANGSLYLTNPAGIYFHDGAMVDVNNLIATTLNMDPDAFMAGELSFSGDSDASIVNAGTIKAQESAALIAKVVENSGKIFAAGGDVMLAARAVELDSAFGGKISVNLDNLLGSVTNRGTIDVSANAGGGSVEMRGETVTHEGHIAADALDAGDGGDVILFADGTINVRQGATTSVRGGPNGGDGGFVEYSGLTLGELRGWTDRRAPMGEYGLLLIDPTDFIIGGTGSNYSAQQIMDDLLLGDVTLETDGGKIELNENIFNAGNLVSSVPTELTFDADTDIFLNASITANPSVGLPVTMIAGDTIYFGDGSILTTYGGDVTLDGAVVLDSATQISTFGALASGDISFLSTLNGAEVMTLVAGSGDVTFTGAVGASTALQQLAVTSAANVTANSSLEADTLEINAVSDTATFHGTVTGNDVFQVSANTITFATGSGSNSGSGTNINLAVKDGNLTIAEGVTLNSGGNVNLSQTGSGGSTLTMGGASLASIIAAGDINNRLATTVAGDVKFEGQDVNFERAVTSVDDADIEVDNSGVLTILSQADFSLKGDFTQSNASGTTNLSGNIVTEGDAISFAGNLHLEEDATLKTDAGSATGGAVSILGGTSRPSLEATELTITAGDGVVTLGGKFGADTSDGRMGAITITHGGLILNTSDFYLEDDFSETGTGNVSVASGQTANLSSTASDITFSNAIDLVGNLNLRTTDGTITLGGDVTGTGGLGLATDGTGTWTTAALGTVGTHLGSLTVEKSALTWTGLAATSYADNLTLIADTLDLTGATLNSAGGTVTIQPLADTTAMEIGTGASAGLAVTQTDITAFDSAGYTALVAGRTDATGGVDINATTLAADFTVNAGTDIDIDGNISNTASGALRFNAGNSIDVNAEASTAGGVTFAGIVADDDTVVNLNANPNTTGSLTFDDSLGTVDVGANVTADGDILFGANDVTFSAASVTINSDSDGSNSAGAIDLASANVTSGDAVTLDAGTGEIRIADLDINALTFTDGGDLILGNVADLDGTQIDLDTAAFDTTGLSGGVTLLNDTTILTNGQNVDLSGSAVDGAFAFSIGSSSERSGTVDLGQIGAGTAVTGLDVYGTTLSTGGTITSEADTSILLDANAGMTVDHDVATTGTGGITLEGNANDVGIGANSTAVVSTVNGDINVNGRDVSLGSGALGGALRTNAGTGNVKVDATGAVVMANNASTEINSGGTISIDPTNVTIDGAGLTAVGDIHVEGSGAIAINADVTSGEDVTLYANTDDTGGEDLSINGTANVLGTTVALRAGTEANSDVIINSTAFNNTAGSIAVEEGDDLVLNADLRAAQGIDVQTSTEVAATATVDGGTTVSFADTIDDNGSGADLSVAATGTVTMANVAGTLNLLDVDAETANLNGTIATGGNIDIDATTTTLGNTINAGGLLDVDGTTLNIAGDITTNGDIDFSGVTTSIATSGSLAFDSTDNAITFGTSATLTDTTAGTLSLDAGTGNITLNTVDLSEATSGLVFTDGNSLSLNGDITQALTLDFTNLDGTITIDNASGVAMEVTGAGNDIIAANETITGTALLSLTAADAVQLGTVTASQLVIAGASAQLNNDLTTETGPTSGDGSIDFSGVTGDITLAGDVVIDTDTNADGGGTLTFGSGSIVGTTDGTESLTIDTFDAAVSLPTIGTNALGLEAVSVITIANVTLNGDIFTEDSVGTGAIDFSNAATGGNLLLGADVTLSSGGGDISLAATGGRSVLGTGDGTEALVIDAETGAVTLPATGADDAGYLESLTITAGTTTLSGDVFTEGVIDLGSVTTAQLNGGGSVALKSDADDDASGGAITLASDTISATNDSLSVTSGNGAVTMGNIGDGAGNNLGGLTVLAESAGAGGGGVIAANGTIDVDGDVTLDNVDGDGLGTSTITLSQAVNASGSIDIDSEGALTISNAIATTGAASTVDLTSANAGLAVNAGVTSVNGAITLEGLGGTVAFDENGDVTSTAGNVFVRGSTGISMADTGVATTVINAGSGAIDLTADSGNISVGQLVTTNNSANPVSITATGGSITDAGDTGGADIIATSGTAVALTANTGIDLDTNVVGVDATNTTSGSIAIAENAAGTDLNIINATNAGGGVNIATADGSLTVVDNTTADPVVSSNGGAISLAAVGAGRNLVLNDAIVANGTSDTITLSSAAGNVSGAATGTVTAIDGATDITATTGDITLGGAIASTGGAITLTAGNDVSPTGSITSTSGDITLNATNDVAATGDISSGTGAIDIDAGNDIATTGTISSTSGDIDLNAGNDVVATGDASSTSGDIDVTAANDLTMLAAQTLESGTGSIDLAATAGDITLGRVESGFSGAGDAITVDATAGAILDADTDSSLDVVATNDSVALSAATGIGSTNAIETSSNALAATSDAGNVQVANTGTGPVTLTDLSVTTGAGNATFTNTGGTLDIVSASTNNGAIDISNDAAITAQSVTANGGNATLVATGGNLTATSVSSTGGSVSLTTNTSGNVLVDDVDATTTITINSAGEIIRTGSTNPNLQAATIDLDAAAGIGIADAIRLAATAISADTLTGDVQLTNSSASAVNVSSLTTTTGALIFTNSGGGTLTIADAETDTGDITIDQSGNHLVVTDAETLTSGAVSLSVDSGNLTVTDLTTGGDSDATLTTTTSGDIFVGSIAVGGGLASLNAAGAIDDATAADNVADITADRVTLVAGTDIGQGANGAVDIVAATRVDADTSASGGDIAINAPTGDLPVGVITTGGTTGDVDLTANAAGASIYDADLTDPAITNVISQSLSLYAANSIGDIDNFADRTGNALEVETATLSLVRVDEDGGEVYVTLSGDADLGSGTVTLGGANAVEAILTATGDLDASGATLNLSNDDLFLAAGDVLTIPTTLANTGGSLGLEGTTDIVGAGASRNLTLTATDLIFTSGNIADITLNTTIDSLTATVDANNLTVVETNGLTVNDATATTGDVDITTSAGDLAATSVTAGNDVTLGAAASLSTGTIDATGTATLSATAGNLTAIDGASLVTADTLDASASGSIGTSVTPYATDVANMTLASSGTGGIYVSENDGVTITSATNADGDIDITTGGDMVATTVTATSGNVDLDSGGSLASTNISSGAGNITLNAATTSNTGTVSATNGNIDITSGGDMVATTVTATTGNLDLDSGGSLTSTTINTGSGTVTLEAATTSTTGTVNSGNGDIGITSGSDMVATTVTATDGDISLDSGGTLTSTTVTTADGSVDLQAAGEIITGTVEANDASGDETHNVTVATTVGDVTISSMVADNLASVTSAGAIVDGSGGETANITATRANLFAQTGIGSSSNPNFGDAEDIDLVVDTVQAESTSGSIQLSDTGNLAIAKVSTTGDVVLDVAGDITDGNDGTTILTGAALLLRAGANIGTLAASGDIQIDAQSLYAVSTSGGEISLTEVDAAANGLAIDQIINTGGQVALTSNVAIEDDANDTLADITASDLYLNVPAMGQGPNGDLDLDISRLEGVFGDGAVTISQIDSTGGDLTLEAWYSGGTNALTLGTSGLATITVADGGVVISDNITGTGGNLTINAATTGDGSGDISLASNATISGVGDVTMDAANDLSLGADTSISGAAIDLDAAGNVAMLGNASVAGSSDVLVDATGNFTMASGATISSGATAGINATGAISLGTGNTIGGNVVDIDTGGGLAMTGDAAINATTDADINATGGNVTMANTSSLSAGGLASITASGNATLSDTAAIDGGTVTLDAANVSLAGGSGLTSSGDATVTASGTYDMAGTSALTATGLAKVDATGDLTLTDSAAIEGGTVDLDTGSAFAMDTTTSVAGTTGTAVTAGTTFAMSNGATLGNGGTTDVDATGDATLTDSSAIEGGTITFDAANVSLADSTALTSTGDTTLTTSGTLDTAGSAAISAGSALTMNVGTNAALTEGSDFDGDSVALTTGGSLALSDATDITATGAVDIDAGTTFAMTDGTTLTAGTDLTVDAGSDITITDGADLDGATIALDASGALALSQSANVTATGTADLSGGTTVSLIEGASVTAGTDLTVDAGTTLTLADSASLDSDTVDLDAGSDLSLTGTASITAASQADLTSGGNLSMADGTTIDGGSTVNVDATGNVAVSEISAGSGTITVNAGGAITDNLTAETANFTTGALILTATGGIGSADDIDTTVTSIDATNDGTGSVQITESGDLVITRALQNGTGGITITTGGNLTVDNAGSGVVASNAASTGDITLDATGDLAVHNVVTHAGTDANADIDLVSQGAVDVTADVTASGGGIDIESGSSLAISSAVSAPGAVNVTANQAAGNTDANRTGTITVADGGSLTSSTAGVNLLASGAITVNGLLNSTTALVLDSGDATLGGTGDHSGSVTIGSTAGLTMPAGDFTVGGATVATTGNRVVLANTTHGERAFDLGIDLTGDAITIDLDTDDLPGDIHLAPGITLTANTGNVFVAANDDPADLLDGNITGAGNASGADVTFQAGHDTATGDLTATGSILVQSGNDIETGALTAEAVPGAGPVLGNDIKLDAPNNITVGGDVLGYAVAIDPINVVIEAPIVGVGPVTIVADNTITQTNPDAIVSSPVSVTMTASAGVGTSSQPVLVDAPVINVSTATANGDIHVTSIDSAGAGASITATAAGANASVSITNAADTDLVVTNITATEDVTITNTGSGTMTLGENAITSGGNVVVNVGSGGLVSSGGVTGDHIVAGGDVTVTGSGSIGSEEEPFNISIPDDAEIIVAVDDPTAVVVIEGDFDGSQIVFDDSFTGQVIANGEHIINLNALDLEWLDELIGLPEGVGAEELFSLAPYYQLEWVLERQGSLEAPIVVESSEAAEGVLIADTYGVPVDPDFTTADNEEEEDEDDEEDDETYRTVDTEEVR